MKSIENKKTELPKKVENQPDSAMSYSDLLGVIIKQPKQGGYGWEDIENRIAISHILTTANGTIDLEDSYFKYLQPLVDKMTWNVFHKDLLQFRNDFMNIK